MKVRHAIQGVFAATLFAGVAMHASAQADNTNSVIAPATDFVGTAPSHWRNPQYVAGQPMDTYYWNGHAWVLAETGPRVYIQEPRVYAYPPPTAPVTIYEGPVVTRH